MNLTERFEAVRKASRTLAFVPDDIIKAVLNRLADGMTASASAILAANARDLSRLDPSNPMYDRLQLTEKRLQEIAAGVREVALLPSPVGRVLEETRRPNGLRLQKVSVPYGVIGVIYEARPNVTFDVFSLCLRSGNACVLKGGSDAAQSNEAAIKVIHQALVAEGLDPDVAELLPSSREATAQMLSAVGYIDLIIPRGGRKLIDFVRSQAKIPCIETGAGVVHTYFDASGDLEKGKAIVCNAKTRRVSVCNALDCLIVHASRLSDLPALCAPLAAKGVEVRADGRAYAALEGYPWLKAAGPDDFGTEFLALRMSIKTVSSLEEAVEHIHRFGSGHSEAIVAEDEAAAEFFRRSVDAACVYTNAPTSFTDGAQFGLGAEIGISTQKLGARGPMGLAELNSYKWLIFGQGQTRP